LIKQYYSQDYIVSYNHGCTNEKPASRVIHLNGYDLLVLNIIQQRTNRQLLINNDYNLARLLYDIICAYLKTHCTHMMYNVRLLCDYNNYCNTKHVTYIRFNCTSTISIWSVDVFFSYKILIKSLVLIINSYVHEITTVRSWIIIKY